MEITLDYQSRSVRRGERQSWYGITFGWFFIANARKYSKTILTETSYTVNLCNILHIIIMMNIIGQVFMILQENFGELRKFYRPYIPSLTELIPRKYKKKKKNY